MLAVVEELQAHDSTIVNSMEIVPMDDDSLIRTPEFPMEHKLQVFSRFKEELKAHDSTIVTMEDDSVIRPPKFAGN